MIKTLAIIWTWFVTLYGLATQTPHGGLFGWAVALGFYGFLWAVLFVPLMLANLTIKKSSANSILCPHCGRLRGMSPICPYCHLSNPAKIRQNTRKMPSRF